MHQMFSVHARPEEFEFQQSPVILDLYLSKTRSKKSHDYRDVIVFEKRRFQTLYHQHKMQNQRFQIPPVEERFRKAPFSRRISVGGRPNCRNKVAFQISLVKCGRGP